MLELSLSTYISTDGCQSFRGLGIITECCRCHKGLRQCRVDNAGHSRDPATARECLLQEPQLRQVMAGCDCHMSWWERTGAQETQASAGRTLRPWPKCGSKLSKHLKHTGRRNSGTGEYRYNFSVGAGQQVWKLAEDRGSHSELKTLVRASWQDWWNTEMQRLGPCSCSERAEVQCLLRSVLSV